MFSLVRSLPFLAPLILTSPTQTATMTLLFGYYSDKLRIRYPFILAALVQLLVGFSIQISAASQGVKYFGIYLCMAGFSAVPGIIAWCALSVNHCLVLQLSFMSRLGNNLAGQCKRSVGMALQIGIGNFTAVIASNIFRAQDGPRYILGRESLPTFSLPCRC
jgi:MFS transporter, ACS family, DAL5 transporter family protein